MFGKELRNFAENLSMLREFVELYMPFLEEHMSRIVKDNPTGIIPIAMAVRALTSEDVSDPKELVASLTRELNGTVDIDVDPDSKSVRISVAGDDSGHIGRAFEDIRKHIQHRHLLYDVSLITLIGFVEWFFSQMLHKYYKEYSGALGTDDKFFSLDQLRSFDSIGDAENFLIESKVSDIIRGSFEEWVAFLKAKPKLSMGYMADHEAKLVEIFQRRNIIVHNGGLVNTVYLNKVAPDLRDGMTSGERLIFHEEYLHSAINLLEPSFILICAELWKKLDPADHHRAHVLADLCYAHLADERWDVAEMVSYFIINDKQMPERSRLVGQMNYWQTLKWQGRFDGIKEDVENVDLSAKEPDFRLARLALLDKVQEFIDLLPDALSVGKPTYQDLERWPIFREIRNSPEYTQFRQEHQAAFEASDDHEQESV